MNASTGALNEKVFEVDGLRVQFPFVPYDCQKDFMSTVIEALKTSPTGTGKTLSLLCASLAWLQREKERIAPIFLAQQESGLINPTNANASARSQLAPKIFYASRTHTQLQQVVRELNKTAYKSQIKVITIAGRDQLCLNEAVLKEQSSEARGHHCRGLTRYSKCHYKNKLEKDGDFADEMYKDAAKGNALDIEDLVEISKILGHCPFYRSRQMFSGADLILLPYTYLLDPKTRDAYEIKLRGNILIFDEAHNLEQIAEESISTDFSTQTLAASIADGKRVLELLLDDQEKLRLEGDESEILFHQLADTAKTRDRENEFKPKPENVANLLQLLQDLETQIDSMDLENGGKACEKNPGRVFSGQKMIEILQKAGIQRTHRNAICTLIDSIAVWLTKNSGTSSKSAWSVRSSHLSEFSTMISRVFVDTEPPLSDNFINKASVINGQLDSTAQNFQLFVERVEETKIENKSQNNPIILGNDSTQYEGKTDGPKVVLHYWCFSASVAMRFLQSRGVRSILVTSGTLAPMNHFLNSMGIPFNGVLESGHVAKDRQLMVAGLLRGHQKVELCGTFKKRGDWTYLHAVGEIIVQAAEKTPQGMLAFFPSYSQMNMFINHWKTPAKGNYGKIAQTIWTKLESCKRIFVEPKSGLDIIHVFREFDETIRTNHQNNGGAILLAVCRGKLSEGIDFADAHCRTVVIAGIPFPPLFDPRIVLKKAWLAERKKSNPIALNPDEWYRIEGFRAVNQALGRIIRHRDDFGAIILADSRFVTNSPQMLPSWIRSMIASNGRWNNQNVYDQPEKMLSVLDRFFAEHGLSVERSRQQFSEQRLQPKNYGADFVQTRKKFFSPGVNFSTGNYGDGCQMKRTCNETLLDGISETEINITKTNASNKRVNLKFKPSVFGNNEQNKSSINALSNYTTSTLTSNPCFFSEILTENDDSNHPVLLSPHLNPFARRNADPNSSTSDEINHLQTIEKTWVDNDKEKSSDCIIINEDRKEKGGPSSSDESIVFVERSKTKSTEELSNKASASKNRTTKEKPRTPRSTPSSLKKKPRLQMKQQTLFDSNSINLTQSIFQINSRSTDQNKITPTNKEVLCLDEDSDE